MWPSGYVLRRGAAGAPDSAPDGPAMTALRSVIVHIAWVLRLPTGAYILVQVAIWPSFYAADPWRLAGPAVVLLWTAAVVWYLRRGWPARQFACLDAAVYVALALSAEACVPPATRGEAANWLVIAMAGQLIVPAWFAPYKLSLPLALALPAAYWIGVAGVPAPGAGVNSPASAGAVLVVVAAVHWCGRRMLRGHAQAADAALARADREASEQYAILSRNIERREHERLVHDTVLNTLTALGRAGPGDLAEVASRCRHDVTLVEHALGDPGGPDGEAVSPYGGLLGGLAAVAAEMRARGLDVHVEVGDSVRTAAGRSPGGRGGGPAAALAVPAAVATAIVHAAREALANVAAHAGTGEAWVQVGLAPAAAGEAIAPDGLRVSVRDEGSGFDPDRVDAARLGLRRSIVERIADWGGRATVWSRPGEGTVVSLDWPGPAAGDGPSQPGPTSLAAGHAGGEGRPQ